MNSIQEVRTKIAEFIKNEFKKEEEAIRFLKLRKSEGGWEGKIEITEENSYLKKLGYPTIFDKNVYDIVLDDTLTVQSYGEAEE